MEIDYLNQAADILIRNMSIERTHRSHANDIWVHNGLNKSILNEGALNELLFAIQNMGLISFIEPAFWLTEKGIKAKQLGGWLKLLELEKEQKEREKALIESTIQSSETQQKVLWITVVVSIGSLVVSIFGVFNDKSDVNFIYKNEAGKILKIQNIKDSLVISPFQTPLPKPKDSAASSLGR